MSLSHCTIVKCEISFLASHWSMASLRASAVKVWINCRLSPVRCSQLILTQLPIEVGSLLSPWMELLGPPKDSLSPWAEPMVRSSWHHCSPHGAAGGGSSARATGRQSGGWSETGCCDWIQEGGISAIQLCESCRDGRGYGPAIYWAGLLGQFSYWVALACLVQQQPH